MQGFILNTQLVRDEDLIVTILTKDSIKILYRFYGIRHSLVSIGNFIDFEEEINYKHNINRLKDVIAVNYDSLILYNLKAIRDYHIFIKLLYKHFEDVEDIDIFYFNMLKDLIDDLKYQNTKRAIIESYVNLLEYEGRLNCDLNCFICYQPIKNNLNISRSFILSHQKCLNSYELFDIKKIKILFEDKSTFMLNDNEIHFLWNILLLGI